MTLSHDPPPPTPSHHDPEVYMHHKAIALIIIGMAVAYQYLRGALLILASLAAAMLVSMNSIFTLEPALFCLPLLVEFLIRHNINLHMKLPLMASLCGASVITLYGVYRIVVEPDIYFGPVGLDALLAAIVFFLPWVTMASQFVLRSEAVVDDGSHAVAVGINRGILGNIQSQLGAMASPSPEESILRLELAAALNDIEKDMFAMSEARLLELRAALAASQGFLLSGNVQLIVEQLAPFQGDKTAVTEGVAVHKQSWWHRQAIALIYAYRILIPPSHKRICRFDPTCSHYTEQAIRKYGLVRGCIVGLKRALKCVPFGSYGWDPVP